MNRFLMLFRRRQFDADLEEEMRHHLAMKAEETGNTDAAQRAFGNVTLYKEDSRMAWTWTLGEQLAQDIRYAFRMMARNPLFTAMATLSLALGIGANTAIYSFMEAVILRSLPVTRPQELVVFQWSTRGKALVMHGGQGSMHPSDDGKGRNSPDYPYAAYEMFRKQQTSLAEIFAYAGGGTMNLTTGQESEVAASFHVSGNFFSALGLSAAAGRLINAEDDRAGAAPVVVLSHKFWQSRYASNPAVVGQTLLINNVPVTIAGVVQSGFYGLDPGSEPKVYLSMHSAPIFQSVPAVDEKHRFFEPNFYWVEMMGRLRPGVSMQEAQGKLAGQFHAFVETTAANDQERADLPWLWLQEGSTGLDSLRRQYSKPIFILMAMVGLILIIACANIANLLLARAAARKREIAVRLSLGAGRLRIIRQLLTESVMLAMIGGAAGLVVAMWGIRFITWLLANGREQFTLHAALNWPVVLFTTGLSLFTGILFGLAPAIQATGVDVSPSLKEARSLGSRSSAFGRTLVIAQLAMSLMLVTGASLFVRTLANLQSIELGFNRENILIFRLNARQAGFKEMAAAHFYEDLRERFKAVPGVESVAMSDFPLAAYFYGSRTVNIPGTPSAGQSPSVATAQVDPNFLGTMQIPVILGRGIEQRDMATGRVAVVTEKFAENFFGKENPVGRVFGIGDEPANIEIVGVAKTTHYNSIKETEIPPVVYLPFTQNPVSIRHITFEVRTHGDPMTLVNPLRQIVKSASPLVPMTNINTQALAIDQTISQERTFADLCSVLAALALVIACVGLYGTMAYSVSRRTGEIGIRMALGAGRGSVIWMVLREVLALCAVGLAIGLLAAWQSSRFIASFLFGMKPADPLAITLSVVVLAAAALIAGYAPARRASMIDPLTALRHE